MTLTPMMIIVTKFIFGFFEDFGRVLATLMLFRFPVKSVYKQAIIIGTINSISDTILLDIMHIQFELNEIISIFIVFLILIYIMRIAFWYSFLLSFIFYIVGTVSQFILGIPLALMDLVTLAEANKELPYMCLIQALGCITGFAIAVPLYKKGIGFYILNDRIKIKEKMSRIVLFIVTISVVLFEISVYYMILNNIHGSDLMTYIFIIMGISFVVIYFKCHLDLRNQYKDIIPKDYDV